MAASQNVAQVSASKLLKFQGRPARFALDKSVTPAEVLDPSGEAIPTQVTRGKRANATSESAPEYIVHLNGDSQAGLPLYVVAYAILGGVITEDEVRGLLEMRKAASK